MSAIDYLENNGSTTDDRLPSHVIQRYILSKDPKKTSKTAKRTADIAGLAPKTRPTSRHRTLMQRTELIDIVRRPLSPDTQLEVPATREEYDQVCEVIESEEMKHPQLLYDSARSVAIVVAAPSPLHSGMASELMVQIRDEVRQGLDSAVSRGISTSTDETGTRATSHGLTTRAWDTALSYTDNDDSDMLMIAIEVGVSQSYESLRAAISWAVCALHCRLGIAMSINEGIRGEKPTIRYYDSVSDIHDAIDRIRREFRDQLTQNPYGPLVNDGVTWFGRVGSVVLQTFRCPDEDCAQETLLDPHSLSHLSEGVHSLDWTYRRTWMRLCWETVLPVTSLVMGR
ncbi:hypothetical protein V1517DRAFT_332700 [Lipomyces orientalis]|uniref:Uncharacterized protein n=1 Tax=Lipomyces orientalis TaxID=1233043 RepID=A0ACC3TE25_9ASCO